MTLTDQPALMPCPFCGGAAKIIYCDPECCGGKLLEVSCDVCDAYLHGRYSENRWNQRPVEDALRAEIERLTNDLKEARELAYAWRYDFYGEKSCTVPDGQIFPWEKESNDE